VKVETSPNPIAGLYRPDLWTRKHERLGENKIESGGMWPRGGGVAQGGREWPMGGSGRGVWAGEDGGGGVGGRGGEGKSGLSK